MAEGKVEQTGVEEMRALYRAMPDRVNAIARRVALATAKQMVVRARGHLQNPSAPIKGVSASTGATAALIDILEFSDEKAVFVQSPSPARYPANTVLWREFGTRRQPARPYMGPAAREVAPQYDREFAAAIDSLCREMSS